MIMTGRCEDDMSPLVSSDSLEGRTQQSVHYSILLTNQRNAE